MKCQRGVTLVGLMVGITISSFILLAMFTVYQNALSRVAVSTISAVDNSERAFGMMLASRVLQSAGFGIDDPQSPSDLLVLNGIHFADNALSVSSSVPTPRTALAAPPGADGGTGTYLSAVVVWRMNANGNSRCQALASGATDTGHGLLHLVSDDACASAQSDWAALSWSARVLGWHPYLGIDGLTPSANQWIGLRLNNVSCWPFGLSPDDNHALGAYSVIVSYPIFNVNDTAMQHVTNTTCLVNYQS